MCATEDLRELYRKTVLDHSRNPRNFRRPEHPDLAAEGHNPLCGDKLSVYVDLSDDCISDLAFEASGCAISVASASMMTECLKGMSPADAGAAVDRVRAMFAGRGELPASGKAWEQLRALEGVRAYPSRVKCATLAWETLRAALAGTSDAVTTE